MVGNGRIRGKIIGLEHQLSPGHSCGKQVAKLAGLAAAGALGWWGAGRLMKRRSTVRSDSVTVDKELP